MLKKNWWKWLGAVLLLYGIFIGTSTKVGPGIAQISPTKVTGNQEFNLNIEGYNTHFNSGNTQVWLKVQGKPICPSSIKIIDQNHLSVSFDTIALNLSGNMLASSVFIENETDGLFLANDILQLQFPENPRFADSVVACGNAPQHLSQQYFSFPYRIVLFETIRNLNFHVPMWFAMMVLALVSFIFSIKHLKTGNAKDDIWANGFAKTALLFGLMGVSTGMFWANFTWGEPWPNDPKLKGAAVGVLLYVAYQVLRSSIDDDDKTGRISAVYNVFAFPMFIVLIQLLPKFMADDSLHPNAGGNSGFSDYDLDNNLRKVFYPISLGWVLVAAWIGQLTARVDWLKHKKEFQLDKYVNE
ncbi:MAG: cytochrome c biogenesis protein CcsA [Flavobacteriales bacterium]|nr:cytochrome c biogenesis protein CcsA [Flavobacteriales bacterium]